MTVESMATRPVESMTPMSTGPRSERNPTPADAACSVLTGTRLGQLSDRRGVGAVAPGASPGRWALRERYPWPSGRRSSTLTTSPAPVGGSGGGPHAEPRRIADHPRARDGAAADD